MSKNVTNELSAQGVEEGWVQVGLIGKPFGVRGDVKLRSFTADPAAIKSFDALYDGPAGNKLPIKIFRPVKGGFSAHIKGYENPEDAAALNGTKIFVPREALGTEDEDEFFLADLIALTVEDMSGNQIGMIHTVENFGADDLLDIILNEPVKDLGTSAMIPFTKQLVPIVDVKAGFVTVNLDLWLEMLSSKKHESQENNGD